jgi:hypothetical protein
LSIVYTIHKRNARGKCEIVEIVMDTSLLFLPPYKRTEIFWAKVGGRTKLGRIHKVNGQNYAICQKRTICDENVKKRLISKLFVL